MQGDDLNALEAECGGHRIQRVPPTERKGRVHTSTVTVAVIDPANKADPKLAQRADTDFKIEWYSGTGAGGQHRNKHQNSCRLTHIPTGIVETAQCRSRQNSYDEAKANIILRLDGMAKGQNRAITSDIRKGQTGSGMRGDKIRTYRFQDNTVKDHNTNIQKSLDKVMDGNFDLLWC